MNNSSDTKIKEVKATLIQSKKYHATFKNGKKKKQIKKSKVNKTTIGEPVIIGIVEANEEKTFVSQFKIPEIPPTHADNEAIGISYLFKLEVRANR